ncbi:site-specific recombinase XerD, partial [Arthrobacter nitrophenolicus]
MDAHALQYCTDRTTGDNTGTGGSRTQHYDAGSGFTLNAVRDGVANAGNAEEGLLGLFNALGDSSGNFLGLAVAHADHAVTVTNDDQCGEAEATTTLDHLGNAVDGDNALYELVLFGFTATVAAATATAVAAALAAVATLAT